MGASILVRPLEGPFFTFPILNRPVASRLADQVDVVMAGRDTLDT